eukprot:142256_1
MTPNLSLINITLKIIYNEMILLIIIILRMIIKMKRMIISIVTSLSSPIPIPMTITTSYPLDTDDIHGLLFDMPDYIRPYYSRSSQSILHVLNGCLPALHQGRYTWRHDTVLNHMYKELKYHIDELNNNNNMSIFQIFADLPNKRYNANTT